MGWVELLKTHSITHISLGYCGLMWVQPTSFRRVNLTNCKMQDAKREVTWWASFSKKYDDSLLSWRVQRCPWSYHVTLNYYNVNSIFEFRNRLHYVAQRDIMQSWQYVQSSNWSSKDRELYKQEFRDHYVAYYQFLQTHEYRLKNKSIVFHSRTLNFIIQTTKFASSQSNKSRSNLNWSEINEYFSKLCISQNDIKSAWRTLKFTLSSMTQMTKNILSILVFDVKIKRLFFLIIYRRNRFHESTVKSIIILKKTFNANRSRETKKIFLSLTNVFLNDEEKKNIIEFTEWINESNNDASQVEENVFVNVNDDVRFFEYFMKLRDSFSQRTEKKNSFKEKKK
jgi:uncharacterized protein YchJ